MMTGFALLGLAGAGGFLRLVSLAPALEGNGPASVPEGVC